MASPIFGYDEESVQSTDIDLALGIFAECTGISDGTSSFCIVCSYVRSYEPVIFGNACYAFLLKAYQYITL